MRVYSETFMTQAEALKEKLKTIAETGKVANAYVISGGSFGDRVDVANAFAALLVSTPADIVRPEHEKPHLISVDDMRLGVNESVYIRPYGTGKKVYIIEEAEKMNVQAQNALLKTLEEPPEYVVMLLLSTHRDCFLQTILSRSVKLSLSESENGEEVHEDILKLLRKGRRMLPEDVLQFVKEKSKEKESAGDFLPVIRSWFRDVLVYKSEKSAKALAFKDDASAIKEYADFCSFAGIEHILALTGETMQKLTANVNFELAVVVLFNEIRAEMEEKDV